MLILPIIAVKNYEASKKFYTEKLGFTASQPMPGREGDGTFGFVLHDDGLQIGLSQDSSALTGRGNGVVLMLYPPDLDIDAYYKTVMAAGVAIKEDIRTEPWGDRLFSVADPDGYFLTFCKTVAPMPTVEELKERMKNQA